MSRACTQDELDEFQMQIALLQAEPQTATKSPEQQNSKPQQTTSKQNYTDKDGVEFEWDASINGFVPILTETLLASNQNQYEYQDPNYSTDENGNQIYTDPETLKKFTWIPEKNIWQDTDGNSLEPDTEQQADENLFKDWTFDNESGAYIDPLKNKWTYDYLKCRYLNEDGWFLSENPIIKNSIEAIEPDTGMHYRLDKTTNKWLELSPEENDKVKEDEEKEKQKKNKKRKKNEWFDQEESQNTTVYVDGLPPGTITVDQFEEMMKKYGIIQFDPVRSKAKVKLYTNRQTGVPKGDGICTYVKRESVDLAIKLLHEAQCPLDVSLKMTVKLAEFKLKGEGYDPKKGKKRRKLTKKEKEGLAKRQESMFAWKNSDEMGNVIENQDKVKEFKNEKILIFKNTFKSPQQFKSDPGLTKRIREQIRETVNSILSQSVQFEGDDSDKVKKIILFDRHHEAPCSVAFKNKDHASYVKNNLNGKMFIVRGSVPLQLSVDFWDGRTNFMVEETAEELEERDKKWLDFLEGKSS